MFHSLSNQRKKKHYCVILMMKLFDFKCTLIELPVMNLKNSFSNVQKVLFFIVSRKLKESKKIVGHLIIYCLLGTNRHTYL